MSTRPCHSARRSRGARPAGRAGGLAADNPGIEDSAAATGPDATTRQDRTAIASLAAAVALVLLKLGTGLATGSLALASAGVESSGDVIAALLTLGAIRLAGRPADSDHNYGHRRAENIAALGEAGIVLVGGCIIAFEAIKRLIAPGAPIDARWYVFAVIGIALSIDVTRIVISRRAARRYASAAFRSNAFNFAGDTAGSLAVLVGLILVSSGVEVGDAIAALVVAGLIFLAVGRLSFENVRALMDYAPPASRMAVAAVVRAEPGAELRRLRLRDVAGRIYGDVTVGVPPASVASETHGIAERIEAAIAEIAPHSDVVVHAEPAMRGADLRERILATAVADPAVRDVHDVAIYTDRFGRCVVTLHVKLDPGTSLRSAHEAAERVEGAIRALDDRVIAVQTHLEPLEAPIPLTSSGRSDGGLSAVVRRLLGRPAIDVETRQTDAGPVALLTIGTDAGTDLTSAHALASQLEHDLRLERPDLVDVVVHTEPT